MKSEMLFGPNFPTFQISFGYVYFVFLAQELIELWRERGNRRPRLWNWPWRANTLQRWRGSSWRSAFRFRQWRFDQQTNLLHFHEADGQLLERDWTRRRHQRRRNWGAVDFPRHHLRVWCGTSTNGCFQRGSLPKKWTSSKSVSTTSGSICTAEATRRERGGQRIQVHSSIFLSEKQETETFLAFIIGWDFTSLKSTAFLTTKDIMYSCYDFSSF